MVFGGDDDFVKAVSYELDEEGNFKKTIHRIFLFLKGNFQEVIKYKAGTSMLGNHNRIWIKGFTSDSNGLIEEMAHGDLSIKFELLISMISS